MKERISFNEAIKRYLISTVIGLGVFLIAAILCIFILPNFISSEFGDVSQATTSGILFGDFAETLSYPMLDNPYTNVRVHSIYPPFAIYLCAPLSFICFNQIMDYNAGNITLAQLAKEPLFLLAYFIYFFITFALIMLFVCLFLKKKGKLTLRTAVVVGLMSPFIFAFERGNNTLSICLFTVMFFYFMEKDNWMKELAYLSLACAVALRIYPILMIMYIVYKAKGKEKIFGVLKALGYTVIVVLLPFIFMKEGFKNIQYLLNNFLGFSETEASTTTASPNQFVLGKNFVIIGGEPVTWMSNISITIDKSNGTIS